MFSGFGTLLIDGDALICHIASKEGVDHSIQNDQCSNGQLGKSKFQEAIGNFLKQLKKSGFHKIKVIFFNGHSKVASNSNEGNRPMTTISNFESVFNSICLDYSILDDWQDKQKLLNFLSTEHINLLITSDLNIYKTDGSQYEFIFKTSASIQVCIISDIIFKNSAVHAFLVHPQTKNTSDQVNTMSSTSEIQLQRKLDSYGKNFAKIYETSNQVQMVRLVTQFNNVNLNSLLRLNAADMPIQNDKDVSSFSSIFSESTFDLQIQRRFDSHIGKFKTDKNLQNQKYYHWMERYSLSLDNCKHLHHKIILKGTAPVPSATVKRSKKELDILKAQETSKQQQRENDDMLFFYELEKSVHSISQLNEKFRTLGSRKFCKKFTYNLLKLKFKMYKYDDYLDPTQRRRDMYIIIKDVFDNYSDFLTNE
jgi:hypothetical protein